MLFRIKIVTPAQFQAWIAAQQALRTHLGVLSDHSASRNRQADTAHVPTAAPAGYHKGSILADWLSSTDHKIIGHLYLITSFVSSWSAASWP